MAWQTTITELPEKLCYVKNTGQFADITLIVGQGEDARKFTVHRLMLAMYSEVMAALFYGPMKETKEEITLPEDDPDSFELMMRFIYCQNVEFFTVEDAIGTYCLADKYIMPQLQGKCLEFLHENITAETVFEIYEMASVMDQPILREDCWKYIARNTTNVLSLPSFNEVSDSVVQRIVREEYLTIVSEIEIYKALWRRGKYECGRAGCEVAEENMHFFLERYLSEVRFLSLSAEEFVIELGEVDILTKEEQLGILKNILVPGICDLPKVCSPRKEKRKPFPSDSDLLRFLRDGERSFSGTDEFGEAKETFQVAQDVCIFGVEFYISLSDRYIVPPVDCEWTLSIRNLIDQSETVETYSSACSIEQGLVFTVQEPLYMRKCEVCEITLQGKFEKDETLFCCIGDCESHPSEFALSEKELNSHFHAIYALPI